MSFPQAVIDNALIACRRHCCLCHKHCGLKMELHHIKPRAEGGKDTFDNCIPLCFDCHADQRSTDHRHPKGRKYSQKELRVRRDAWYQEASGLGERIARDASNENGPVLKGKLSFGLGTEVLNYFGCPALILSVSCQSARPAKIQAVNAWIKGVDVMRMIDNGFGGRLGYKPPPPELRNEETFYVELVGLDSSSEKIILEQDDAREFGFPVSFPGIHTFLDNPGKPSGISVVLVDDTEIELDLHPNLAEMLHDLHQSFGARKYNSHITIKCGVRVLQPAPPSINLEAVGTLNEFPVPLADQQTADTTSLDARADVIVRIGGTLINQRLAGQPLQCVIKALTPIENVSFAQLKEMPFLIQVGPQAAKISLKELAVLYQFIAKELQEIKDSVGNQKPGSHEEAVEINMNPSDAEIAAAVERIRFLSVDGKPVSLSPRRTNR